MIQIVGDGKINALHSHSVSGSVLSFPLIRKQMTDIDHFLPLFRAPPARIFS